MRAASKSSGGDGGGRCEVEEGKRSVAMVAWRRHGNAAALKEMLAAGSAEAMAEAATTVAVKMRARWRW